MNSEKQIVACPYCGHNIDNSIEKCPNCGELFVEPKIPSLKFVSVPLYLVAEITLSSFFLNYIYTLFWLIANLGVFYKIANKKDKKKLLQLFSLFSITVILSLPFKPLFLVAAFFVEIFLSYRILRIIEKYTQKEYGPSIIHNELWMGLFRTLYVIYFIDTYNLRVRNPNSRYFLDKEGWFEYLVILIVLVYILYGL